MATAPTKTSRFPLAGMGGDVGMVRVVAAIAAGVAVFADAAPTGVAWWDAVLRAVFAAAVTGACATAPRFVPLVVAGVATAFSSYTIWLAIAGVALIAAIAAMNFPERRRVVGAAIGAAAVQALLRFDSVGFFGLPSILVGSVCLLAFVFAYRYSRPNTRLLMSRLAAIGATAIFAVLLVFGVFVLGVRSDAQSGVESARRGLQAVRDGDAAAVVAELTDAERSLGRADDKLGAFWLKPVQLIPVVSQHQRALHAAVGEGSTVSHEAALAVGQADIDTIKLSAGSVDLSALTEMGPQLTRTANALTSAFVTIEAARSPWLVEPVDRRLRGFLQELADAVPEAQLSAEAAQVLPGLLGSDGPRRYFVIFGSPAESRELGGFVGSYALLEFDDGRMSKIESGRSLELYDRSRVALLDHPAGYPDLFMQSVPLMWPQNLTGMTDIAEVARAVRDVFPEMSGAPIDGVMYLDPYAIAAMLELTGPVSIDGVAKPLTSGNVAEFLVREQYIAFESGSERFEALLAVLDSTFELLTTAELPGPARLGRVLGPAARQGRLQLATFDEPANAFLRHVFLLRDFPRPDGQDFLAVVQANGSANKLDTYLHRTVNYDVNVDPESGALRGTVTVDLFSDVPDDAPQYTLGFDEVRGVLPGQNNVLLSIYTPHALVDVRVDGESQDPSPHLENEFWRYLQPVVVDPGQRRTVVFELDGVVDPSVEYHLRVANQPLVNDDFWSFHYTSGSGADAESAEAEFVITEDVEINADGEVTTSG